MLCTGLGGHTTSRTMVLPSRSTTSTPMGRALGLAIAVAAIDVKRIVKIPVVFILMLLYVFCVCKGMMKEVECDDLETDHSGELLLLIYQFMI